MKDVVRTSLVFAGLLVTGLGALLFGIETVFSPLGGTALPSLLSPATPFVAAGLIMLVIGAFLREGSGPVQPPEGFAFCVYCGNLMKSDQPRCDKCGGLQPGFEPSVRKKNGSNGK
jgi:hypothetical protein